MQQKERNTTVAISPDDKKNLEKFCRQKGITQKDFIPIALAFFNRYDINPAVSESPTGEMEKIRKRLDQVFAFFKTQEKDLIRPMFQAVAASEERIKSTLEQLPTQTQVQGVGQSVSNIKQIIDKDLYSIRQDLQGISRSQEQSFKYLGHLIDAKEKTSILGDLSKAYNQQKQL